MVRLPARKFDDFHLFQSLRFSVFSTTNRLHTSTVCTGSTLPFYISSTPRSSKRSFVRFSKVYFSSPECHMTPSTRFLNLDTLIRSARRAINTNLLIMHSYSTCCYFLSLGPNVTLLNLLSDTTLSL